jgi:hypothetical protein
MKLVWKDGAGSIRSGATEWPITVAPTLPFEYSGIFYNDDTDARFHYRADGARDLLTDDEVLALRQYIEGQQPPAAVPNPAAEEAELTAAVQQHLDEGARQKGYGSILAACSYAASTDATFAAEAATAVAWRDAVWAYCYAQLARYQAGQRAQPTAAQLIAELPPLVW